MSRTLILIRHAKSDWDDPLLDDFDRPLNPRGRRSAAAVGQWLAERGHIPDACLLSGARRTVETWEVLSSAFASPPRAREDRRLYHASREVIMDVLRGAEGTAVALVGHNPGFADFAAAIVGRAPAHPRFADYPTCATTVMRFGTGSWKEIGWGQADVADFTVPRDLE
jgi:phosphohistidine phosphatase